MIDENKLHELEGTELETSGLDPVFPSEPFACPACGQMLAPNCRVCVACRQPIDPAALLRPTARTTAAEAYGPPPELVRFPWRMFFLILGAWMIAATTAERLLGPVKSQLVLGGVQVLTSIWVFYDAQQRRLPKPLRWGLGSLLLWPVVFPWYLVRRRRPEARCPFVEAAVGPITRAVLVLLLLVFFFLIFRGASTP